MKERLRLGLVGAGAIAGAYVDAIAKSSSARLTAVADVNLNAAQAIATKSGATAFASHGDLAASGLCDAVVVTTPPVTHATIAIELLSQRFPVLCEKPLTVDLASAFRMMRAATEHDVLLSMASKFRFCNDVVAAHDMLNSGVIGTPVMLDKVFTGIVDIRNRWNSDPEQSGGGVLIDNGTHSVDIVRYLLGQITEVLAIPGPRIQPIFVEDNISLMARTQDDHQASIQTSWSVHKDLSAFISIYGTEGTIEVGWKGSRVRKGRKGSWEQFGSGYDKLAAFRHQIDHFAAAVGGDEMMLPDVHDAVASVLVIQAAYRSLAQSMWTRVEHFPRPVKLPLAAQAS